MVETRAPACPHCAGRGWILTGDGGDAAAKRCSCHGQVPAASLLASAAVPYRYQRCSFDSFRTSSTGAGGRDQLVRALADCRRYVEGFLEADGRFRDSGLLFIGPPGVGKTHLAVAVLSELIATYRVRGRFVDFTSLIHEIQSTFDPDAPGSKREIIEPICEAEVLVLDELGAQKPTAWVLDLLYLVMNSRYAERRPTLFTTNYRLEEQRPEALDGPIEAAPRSPGLLAHRIPAMLISRLYEMAKPIFLDAASDYRREIQMHQHRL